MIGMHVPKLRTKIVSPKLRSVKLEENEHDQSALRRIGTARTVQRFVWCDAESLRHGPPAPVDDSAVG
eukprot:316295-Amphidinium_carterae.2